MNAFEWVQSIINNLKRNKTIFFPLSPNCELNLKMDAKQEYYIYEKHLNQVFKCPEICNIAITGNYGIGKSSIIHTFDCRRRLSKLRARQFLYVSLTNFRAQNLQTPGSTLENLERDLLCQILYVCNDIQKIPGTTYRLIPAPKSRLRRFFPAIAIVILVGSVFVAYSSTKLSSFFNAIMPVSLLDWYSAHNEFIYSLPYGLILICLLYFSWKLAIWLLSSARLTKLSFEGSEPKLGIDKVDMDIESVEGGSYLDKHGFELVYVLERMAAHFDYTIVFEDMDRLDRNIQKTIFAELREINYLINSRLAHKKRLSPCRLGSTFPALRKIPLLGNFFRFGLHRLRFLYVTHDAPFSPNECAKFFDYILPVIPAISNEALTDHLVQTYLPQVGIELREDDKKPSKRPSIFFAKAAPYLNDYRTIHTILNEYQVFASVEEKRGLLKNQDDRLSLLSYVIYKNLCPVDYYRIHTGQSIVFPLSPRQGIGFLKEIRNPFVQDLARKGFLPWDSIMYAGYSTTWLLDVYYSILSGTDIDKKRSLLQTSIGGHFHQRSLCLSILLEFSEDKLIQSIDGIQLSLVVYLLKSLELNIENSDLEQKARDILTRSIRPCKNLEEDSSELCECLKSMFWKLSSDSQLFLLQYLITHGYEFDGAEEWLFIKDASADRAAAVWKMLYSLKEEIRDTLISNQQEAVFQWMCVPAILTGIHQAHEDEVMLEIVRNIASSCCSLPHGIGEMKFNFVHGAQQKSLQTWLDEGRELQN